MSKLFNLFKNRKTEIINQQMEKIENLTAEITELKGNGHFSEAEIKEIKELDKEIETNDELIKKAEIKASEKTKEVIKAATTTKVVTNGKLDKELLAEARSKINKALGEE